MALAAVNNGIAYDVLVYIRKLFNHSYNGTHEADYSIPQNERQQAILEYINSLVVNGRYEKLSKIYLVGLAKIHLDTTSYEYYHYGYELMLAEWMVDIPHDFLEKWIMIPCPQGKRSILIADKGITSAYSKEVQLSDIFYSVLPGGNCDTKRQGCTILDCVWLRSLDTFYVLDVLVWGGQPVVHCEIRNRLLQLNNCFSQLPQLKDKDVEKNTYPIMLLPNVPCSEDLTEALRNFNLLHFLDGVLFYHRESPYIYGYSPLVRWLKPFMLSEVLGVTISIPDHMKPRNYMNYRQYIFQTTEDSKKIELLRALFHLP